MSGQNDIKELAARIAETYAGVHGQSLTLDELLAHAERALSDYRKFQAACKEMPFDVVCVRKNGADSYAEEPFDWRAFYADETPELEKGKK